MHAHRMNAQQLVGPSDVSKYGINSKAWYQGQNRSYKEEFLHVGRFCYVYCASLFDEKKYIDDNCHGDHNSLVGK